jgi:hypothetical protein
MAEKTGAELVEDINKSFLELKAENDKGRKADKEVLAKIEADLARADAENQKRIAEAEKKAAAATAKAEALEALMGRMKLGSPAEEKAKTCGRAQGAADPVLPHRPLRRGEGAGAQGAPEGRRHRRRLPDEPRVLVRHHQGRGAVQPDARARPGPHDQQGQRQGCASGPAVSSAAWVAELETRVESTNPAYGTERAHRPRDDGRALRLVRRARGRGLRHRGRAARGVLGAVRGGRGHRRHQRHRRRQALRHRRHQPGVTSKNSGARRHRGRERPGDGIIDTFHDLPSEFAQNARWLLNRKTLGAVRKLKDSQKRYLWEPSPAAGLPSTILGAPYTETPDMDDEGAGKFPMAVGDWRRAYTLLDRVQLAVVRDELTKASVGQVKFVARRRVGGKVVLANAARLLKCDVSPSA